jgi:hypothetical protein
MEETRMPEYRQKKTDYVWHWSRNCTQWPTYDYVVLRTEPTEGTKCEECKQKQTAQDQE